ncbi:hypothetical protein [Agromyces mariniharenae]|uniref:Uncharacterized protein n=1 Tax=Agromyces mariniharenae TaxID=2604423 RepID=A0A5S4V8A1_9MICO|nr:hypothetical protein [Agromyces mariniharenae]TYL50335.1 hypothetical protein FYC51_14065 [Agromyces mariniharenae]
MLHAQVAGPTEVDGIVIPIIVTLITIAGAIIVPRLRSNADDLRRAESLTSVLDSMPPSSERRLLEQLRDDHAIVWSLRQAAPPLPTMRAVGSVAYAAGIVVLIVGVVYLLAAPGYQWWFWLVYIGGVADILVGWLVHRFRTGRRRTWMAAELQRLGLRLPIDARLRREVSGPLVAGVSPRAGIPPST